MPPAGWGYVMLGVGTFFLLCASTKSDFILYRLCVARSRMMWGEKVHGFYQVLGIAFIVSGGLRAAGVW